METSSTKEMGLKEAIEKFGSLTAANQYLKKENHSLSETNQNLKKQNQSLVNTNEVLVHETENLRKTLDEHRAQNREIVTRLLNHKREYDLFCGFLAMMVGSSSVNDSIDGIIEVFQKLKETGWGAAHKAVELRTIFVRTIMGDGLKSYKCDDCGGRFVSNRIPKRVFTQDSYWCPFCDSWKAKEDDSFLKAMVSDKQLDNIRILENVQREKEALVPFKAFFNVPCDICHEPVKVWNEGNIKRAVQGFGCGHTACWNSNVGQIKETILAIKWVRNQQLKSQP